MMYEAHFKRQQWDFMPNRCLKLFFFVVVASCCCLYVQIHKDGNNV